jgi:hypothetical protein
MGRITIHNPWVALGILGGLSGAVLVLVGGIVAVAFVLYQPRMSTPSPVLVEQREEIHTWEINPIHELDEILIEDVDVGTEGIQISGSSSGGSSTTLFIEELVFEDVTAPTITLGASLGTGSVTIYNLVIDGLACEGWDILTTTSPPASQVNLLPYDIGTGDSETLQNSITPHLVIQDGTSTSDGPGKVRKLTLRRVSSRGPITITNVAIGTGDFSNISAGDGDRDFNQPDCIFGFDDGKLLVGSSATTGATNVYRDYR